MQDRKEGRGARRLENLCELLCKSALPGRRAVIGGGRWWSALRCVGFAPLTAGRRVRSGTTVGLVVTPSSYPLEVGPDWRVASGLREERDRSGG